MKIYRLEIGIDTEHEEVIYVDESITEDQQDIFLDKGAEDKDTSYYKNMVKMLDMNVDKVCS